MRTIKYTSRFTRDYKREKKSGHHGSTFESEFLSIVNLLALDKPLPASHLDHALTNNWKDHRDCHIKPDLVLIYRKPDPETLELVRMGSHSELSL